ncbi:hypothetical protein Plhal304r1_c020g0071751 [Plasmopara halstedii]
MLTLSLQMVSNVVSEDLTAICLTASGIRPSDTDFWRRVFLSFKRIFTRH